MTVRIGQNISSLGAQRFLAKAGEDLARTSERLSSGLRINRASDDAAGLAIASTLNTQTRIFTQSTRNINDSLSATYVADGAIVGLTDIVIRLQELAEQSANGTYSQIQRQALHTEGVALRDEYNRVVATTSFNGIKLLNGEGENLLVQAGTTDLTNPLYVDATIGREITVTTTGGDGTFSGITSFSGLTGMLEMKTGLLNNDAFVDVVSILGNRVTVLLGNGDGTFKAQASYSVTTSFQEISLGDLNNDNITDILVPGGNGNPFVSILFGNSNGSFNSAVQYNTATASHFATIGDFNSDGRNDIAVSNFVNSTVTVLLANNDGTFLAPTSMAVAGGGFPGSMVATDVDGDQRADLVVKGFTGNALHVYLSNSNGTFNAATTYFATSNSYTLEFQDVNGDGRKDALYTNQTGSDSSSAMYVLLANSNGSFGAAVSFKTDYRESNAMVIADLNGDGYLDAFTGNTNATSSGSILYGNGNGTFKAATSISLGATVYGVGAADLNNDGAPDLIATNNTAGTFSVRLGTATTYTNQLSTPYLGTFDLTTQSGSLTALTQFQDASANLSSIRGRIGATQSRLSSAANTVMIGRQNSSHAATRITNADVAEESSRYLSAQVAQQAASAVLAQANQQPNLVLRLIGS